MCKNDTWYKNPPDSRSHATFPPDDYSVIGSVSASKRSEDR